MIPSRANRMDDLSETVRLLHALKTQGIEDWRFGVALNALRAPTAEQDDQDARAYLTEAGYQALPGFVRDLKPYEIALLEGKAITETDEETLNDEAFVLVNGIAGAVLEAGQRLTREAWKRNEREPGTTATKEDAGDDEEQFRRDGEAADFCEAAAPEEGVNPVMGYGAVRIDRRP